MMNVSGEFSGEVISSKKIESFGLLLLNLIYMYFFYERNRSDKLKSAKRFIDGVYDGKKIIEYIAGEYREFYESWEFLFFANEDDLLNLAIHISGYEKNNDFLCDVLDLIASKNNRFFSMSEQNISHISNRLRGNNSREGKRGPIPKDQIQTDMATSEAAVISGFLTAGKGIIKGINSKDDVFEGAANLCSRSVAESTIRNRCYQDKNGEGAILRNIVQECAEKLFLKVKDDKGLVLPMPSALVIYMVLFRLVVANEPQLWTECQTPEGIPQLVNI